MALSKDAILEDKKLQQEPTEEDEMDEDTAPALGLVFKVPSRKQLLADNDEDALIADIKGLKQGVIFSTV